MDIDEFNDAETEVWDGINGIRRASPPAEAILLLARVVNELVETVKLAFKPQFIVDQEMTATQFNEILDKLSVE